MNFNNVYLDHNATTPLAPDVKNFVVEHLEEWGNPSSIHFHGREPKALLRVARLQIAQHLRVQPLEIVFTSGGSEANNLALKGLLNKNLLQKNKDRRQILVSGVEHPSVIKTALHLRNDGYEVKTIPVNRQGQIDFEQYEALVNDQTALVACMLANNETGHIFPIAKMVEIAKARGALFHCDAVQGLGKMNVDVAALGVDTLSFSGHKFYSIKGAGGLFVRRGLELESLIHGGGQERGRRAGTENALAIGSLGFMCSLHEDVGSHAIRLQKVRDQMENEILKSLLNVEIIGRDQMRLPNTSCLIIDDVDGETLLMNLDMQGFSVSTGAACSSGSAEPSPVLLAMGYTRREAQSSLRISLGWFNTWDEIERFVVTLKDVVSRIRGFHSVAVEAVC